MINKYGRSIIPEKDCPRWQVYLPSFYMKLKNGHKVSLFDEAKKETAY